jgi:hypothetical protein
MIPGPSFKNLYAPPMTRRTTCRPVEISLMAIFKGCWMPSLHRLRLISSPHNTAERAIRYVAMGRE